MRVSCLKLDPGYANFRGYGAHRVLLNGIEQGEAVTADEERGYVVRLARDEYGEPVVDHYPIDGRCLVHERVYGKVEVETRALPIAASGAGRAP